MRKNLILIILIMFCSILHSQNIESKIQSIVKDHIQNYEINNKSIDNLIVYYENDFFNDIYKLPNIIVLNNRNDLFKLIKRKTYLINFKVHIEDNKLYVSAVHFKVERDKRKINMINQMDGKDYYICDLIEK